MADVLRIGNQEFKKRSPLGAWGLLFLTIGVYYFVWYYKINDEARRYLGDDEIKPGISLLAILLGWALIVPPYISIYRTGQRIQRMQEKASVAGEISPALGLLASFVMAANVPYMQENLNKVWRRYEQPGGGVAAGSPPPPDGGSFTG
jgi:uncharacterized membrane protein HdeD (DUF308 family)